MSLVAAPTTFILRQGGLPKFRPSERERTGAGGGMELFSRQGRCSAQGVSSSCAEGGKDPMTAADSSPTASSLQTPKLQCDKTDSELPGGTTGPKQRKLLTPAGRHGWKCTFLSSSYWSSRCLRDLLLCCHLPAP